MRSAYFSDEIGAATDYTAAMSKRVSKDDRLKFIQALRRKDDCWSECFGDDFYQLHFSDLFTKMWQDAKPVARSSAYQFTTHLSEQTAKKYVKQAIEAGLLMEIANPHDGRSRLIQVSPLLQEKMERWLDVSVKAYRDRL
mgnify:CR=1 FL=1